MFISFVRVGLCISGLVIVLLKLRKCRVGIVSVLFFFGTSDYSVSVVSPMFLSTKLLVGGSHVFIICIMVSSGAESRNLLT